VAEGVVAGRVGVLPEWISIGVLAGSVPRDVVDTAVTVCGRDAKRAGGKLPPHVMVYFTMALALFADDDYEEVITRLVEPLTAWGCWDGGWQIPTSGGLTQARARLGHEPLVEVFDQVAVPVATELTRGAWLGERRLVAVDGFVWDAPDTTENVAAFGRGSGTGRSGFAQVRVVTLSECGSHAVIGARIGAVAGPRSGEQTLARQLYPQLDEEMLLIADRGFYGFADWSLAADTGAGLLWRVGVNVSLPWVDWCDDGSYLALVIDAKIRGTARDRLVAAARAGVQVDSRQARLVRVIQYEVVGRDGDDELICLITTIVDPGEAGAQQLAQCYAQRWEHETGNDQLKTHLRGPARVLRSKSPDLVRAEIYGYLLTHYAISALICRAATEADIDPDRVKFVWTVRVIRRHASGPAALSP
jgi:hypothetical protein